MCAYVCAFPSGVGRDKNRGNGLNIVHKQFLRYLHGVIDSSQHLHHELRVQQHTVARFPPKLLLLPGEATYTQPEQGRHTYTVIWGRWLKSCSVRQQQREVVKEGKRRQRLRDVPQFKSQVPSNCCTDQMGISTKGNIRHFLAKIHKEKTHQTSAKGTKFQILPTYEGQARLDDKVFGVYAVRLNSKSVHCSRKSSQSQFAVFLGWACFRRCLSAQSQ